MKKMSLANTIGIIAIIVAILGVVIAYIYGNSGDVVEINQSSTGENSPNVGNTKGNVEIKLK